MSDRTQAAAKPKPKKIESKKPESKKPESKNPKSKKPESKKPKPKLKSAVRKTARWRIVIRWMIPLFLLIALMGGMAFGYVIIGKQSWSEVLQWKTWQHVIDLVFAP